MTTEDRLKNREQIVADISKIAKDIKPGNGGKPVYAPARDDSLLGRVEEVAGLCRDIGRYLREIGDSEDDAAKSFAEQLERHFHEYINTVLARKRKELSEIERIIGKSQSA